MASQLLDLQTAEHRARAEEGPPYLDLPLAQFFPSVPEVLEYETRWVEIHNGESLPRVMALLFYPHLGLFHVMPDDAKVPLRVAVYSRSSATTPIPPWELHVGAVIDILGRSVTLAKATHATVTWLDGQARRLYKKKVALEVKLNKYLSVPKTWNVVGAPAKRMEGSTQGSTVYGGVVNLHNLATCVMNIETELSKYM